MSSRDDEEASRKSEQWRNAFDRTARSLSPSGVPAVQPGAPPSPPPEAPPGPSSSQVIEVIQLTRELGLEVIKLVTELRGMKRQVSIQNAIGVVVGAAFVVGAYVMWTIHIEQMAARERDRQYVTQRIEYARQELTEESRRASKAAEEAAESARHAAAESLMAQIEAAEVQARISPPRQRAKVQAKIEKKKQAAKALGADL